MPTPFWPCPNGCEQWRRDDIRFVDGKPQPAPNHHPTCEHVNATLIDVWRVTVDGTSFITAVEQDALTTADAEKAEGHEPTITKEKMHREVYDQLPEFDGF